MSGGKVKGEGGAGFGTAFHRDAAAEGFAQFSVQNGDPHNRGASQTVSRSADRLNRSNIPFFRRKVKNGVCGKSAEIFLSY